MSTILAVALVGCGGGSRSATGPSGGGPTPAPTPTPAPSVNPYAAACGTPLPRIEDMYGFGVKVQLEPTRNKKVLNASPLVRNADYCQAAGTPAAFCRTRIETDPERVPCDHYIAGISETGRPGPNWFKDVGGGRLLRCGGEGVPEETSDCRLKPENQYLLDIFAPGNYKACGGVGSNRTCGVCIIDPSAWGKIHPSPAGLCGNE